MMLEEEELQALRDLQQVWDRLESIATDRAVRDGLGMQPVNLRAYRKLLGRAHTLFGRTRHLIEEPSLTMSAGSVDPFMQVLGNPDLLVIRTNRFWENSWGPCSSAIAQAIGRQEGRVARVWERGLNAETIRRWRSVIVWLERLRVIANWPFSRLRFLGRFVAKFEQSPARRLVSVLADFGGLIFLIALVIAAVSVLARCS